MERVCTRAILEVLCCCKIFRYNNTFRCMTATFIYRYRKMWINLNLENMPYFLIWQVNWRYVRSAGQPSKKRLFHGLYPGNTTISSRTCWLNSRIYPTEYAHYVVHSVILLHWLYHGVKLINPYLSGWLHWRRNNRKTVEKLWGIWTNSSYSRCHWRAPMPGL